MKTTQINLGEYQYICELYKNGIDFNDINYKSQFIMLRRFEIYNDIVYDKDIFFIDKKIYNSLEKNTSTDKIVYPLHDSKQVLKFSNLGELYSYYNMSSIEDFKYDIKCDSTNDYIQCDKLRIYNPTIKNDLEYIVYVNNYINDIHFHYICNLSNNYEKKYEKEFEFNHHKYVEFIEIKLPSIDFLFDKNNKVYFTEDFNKIKSTNNITNYYIEEDESENTDNKFYLSTLIKPYFIDKDTKVYLLSEEYNNDFINKSLNITLYPYEDIVNNIYNINHSINSTSTVLNDDRYYFNLVSKLGFVDGNVSLINNFIFPGKIEEKDHYSSVEEAEAYEAIINSQIRKYYNTYYINETLEKYERESYLDEIDIEEIRSTGFYIQFANDVNFKEIVYESKINIDSENDNFIYDFSFSLNNLFESWDQLNEILVIRTTFIDKRLGIFIRGNNVVLTKEWFKYLINDSIDGQVIYSKQNNLITHKFMDVNQGFNLIHDINCVIVDKETVNSSGQIQETNVNTKIVYKPIFYKVQDLQNIRLHQGVTQNIGINLGGFLTKVDTFILNINGKNYKESARNDVFVIFKINANNIEENSGYYNILDQNFDYISSGNYTLY